jgi:hypothetical protein
VCSIEEKPEKCSIYTTFLGLLNAKEPTLVGEIVAEICTALQSAIDKAKFVEVEVLLRFLADLTCTNVTDPTAMMALLNLFVETATAPDGVSARCLLLMNRILQFPRAIGIYAVAEADARASV